MPHSSGAAVALLTLGPAHGSQIALPGPVPATPFLVPLQDDLRLFHRAEERGMRPERLRVAVYERRMELCEPKNEGHYIYEYTGERV